jgi:hypothetical protein
MPEITPHESPESENHESGTPRESPESENHESGTMCDACGGVQPLGDSSGEALYACCEECRIQLAEVFATIDAGFDPRLSSSATTQSRIPTAPEDGPYDSDEYPEDSDEYPEDSDEDLDDSVMVLNIGGTLVYHQPDEKIDYLSPLVDKYKKLHAKLIKLPIITGNKCIYIEEQAISCSMLLYSSIMYILEDMEAKQSRMLASE